MKKVLGYLIAIIGFILILISAINYIFSLNFQTTALFVIGIVFIIFGMGIVKKIK